MLAVRTASFYQITQSHMQQSRAVHFATAILFHWNLQNRSFLIATTIKELPSQHNKEWSCKRRVQTRFLCLITHVAVMIILLYVSTAFS